MATLLSLPHELESRAKGSRFRDEGLALLRLLHPEDESIRSRVWEASQSLQELELQGYMGFSNASAAWLGSYLGTLPRLHTIRIIRPRGGPELGRVSVAQVPESFFAGLSVPSPALQLRDLDITALRLSHWQVLALSHLTGLQTLSCGPEDHVKLGPLSSLQQLTSLSLHCWWTAIVREDMAWLAELHCLQSLSLSISYRNVAFGPVLEMLPPSLHTLFFDQMTLKAEAFGELAEFVRPDRLPNMRCIEVKEMELYTEDGWHLDWDAFGQELSAWLSAFPQLSIHFGWLETASDMDGFLTLCTLVPAMARGIKAALVLNAPTCLVDVHWCPTRLDGYDMDFSTSDNVTKMKAEDRKQEMAALKTAWERMSRAMPVKGSRVKLRTRFQSKEL